MFFHYQVGSLVDPRAYNPYTLVGPPVLQLVQYPLAVLLNELRATTRAVTSGKLVEIGVSIHAKNTFYNDGVKAWNRAPDEIKNCKTIWAAKKAIKSFVKSLPM